MSSFIGMTHKAPRLEYNWNLSDTNTRIPEGDRVLATSMVSYVDNDLLTYLCDLEIGIGANDLTEDKLRAWSQRSISRRSSMSQEW